MDGPAPAIINAVEDALGVRFDFVPLLPEDIMDGLAASSPITSRSTELVR